MATEQRKSLNELADERDAAFAAYKAAYAKARAAFDVLRGIDIDKEEARWETAERTYQFAIRAEAQADEDYMKAMRRYQARARMVEAEERAAIIRRQMSNPRSV